MFFVLFKMERPFDDPFAHVPEFDIENLQDAELIGWIKIPQEDVTDFIQYDNMKVTVNVNNVFVECFFVFESFPSTFHLKCEYFELFYVL